MATINRAFFWNPSQANVTAGGTNLNWNYTTGGSNWTLDTSGKTPITTNPLYPGDTGGGNTTGQGSVVNIIGNVGSAWKVPTTGPGSQLIISSYNCSGGGNNFGVLSNTLTSNIVVNLTISGYASPVGANPTPSYMPSVIGNKNDPNYATVTPCFYGAMYNYVGAFIGGPGSLPPYPLKLYGGAQLKSTGNNSGIVTNLFLYDYATNTVIGNYPNSGVKYEYILSTNANHADGATTVYSMLSHNDSPWAWPQLTNWVQTGGI